MTHLLSTALIEQIGRALREGVLRQHAATILGFASRNSFNRWLSIGAELREQTEKGEIEPDRRQQLYIDLRNEVEAAEAERVGDVLKALRSAAVGSGWKQKTIKSKDVHGKLFGPIKIETITESTNVPAAIAYLKAVDPERFARRHVDHSGEIGPVAPAPKIIILGEPPPGADVDNEEEKDPEQ